MASSKREEDDADARQVERFARRGEAMKKRGMAEIYRALNAGEKLPLTLDIADIGTFWNVFTPLGRVLDELALADIDGPAAKALLDPLRNALQEAGYDVSFRKAYTERRVGWDGVGIQKQPIYGTDVTLRATIRPREAPEHATSG